MRYVIFRYEQDDGGGPLFDYEGNWRENEDYKVHLIEERLNNILYGCLTQEDLRRYWNYRVPPGCTMKMYEGEVVKYNESSKEVKFKKDTARELGWYDAEGNFHTGSKKEASLE